MRQLFALLLSAGLAFVSSAAWAQADLARQKSVGSSRTTASSSTGPLAPGAAAGIKQAQGAQADRIWNYVPFGVVGGLALLIVLTGDDDDEATTTTTGTN